MTGRSSKRTPLILIAYLIAARFSTPIWHIFLWARSKAGLEHTFRFKEKMGIIKLKRPSQPLIWFHAVSVGEALALRSIISDLVKLQPDLTILLTTSRLASWETLEKIGLPPNTIHQFTPVENIGAIERFLEHWRPDIAIVTERDFWPAKLHLTRKWADKNRASMLLINARMSDESLRKRLRFASLYRHLLDGFDQVILQDQASQSNFQELGVKDTRIQIVGPLKNSTDPLADSPDERQRATQLIKDRPVWLAASTHIRETENLIEAHMQLRSSVGDALTLIAPRKPEGVDQLVNQCGNLGIKFHLRSKHDVIPADCEIYIIDLMGEMGIWMRVAPIVFMGFSLAKGAPAPTGKNPFEALQLGAVVLHGPDYKNFSESYDKLLIEDASIRVDSAANLASAVEHQLQKSNRTAIVEAAKNFVTNNTQSRTRTVEIISQHLNAPQSELAIISVD